MAPEPEAQLYPKQMAGLTACAAGILPLGLLGTVADFRDLDAFRAVIGRSRRLGFTSASVIHPGQVAVLNEEFRPQSDEVDHAKRLLGAYREAVETGRGTASSEGRM